MQFVNAEAERVMKGLIRGFPYMEACIILKFCPDASGRRVAAELNSKMTCPSWFYESKKSWPEP